VPSFQLPFRQLFDRFLSFLLRSPYRNAVPSVLNHVQVYATVVTKTKLRNTGILKTLLAYQHWNVYDHDEIVLLSPLKPIF
jgi:hypothetical protein